MSKNVTIIVVTKDSVQPIGIDVATPFTYSITALAGIVVVKADDVATTHLFDAVAPGDYIAIVTKFGVSVQASFTVPVYTVTVQVPDTITVNVAA